MKDENLTRPATHSPHEPRVHDELVALALAGLTPEDFFREFLRRVLDALTLPAGAVWTRNDKGDFLQQCQLNPGQPSLELEESSRHWHDDLLRQAVESMQPTYAALQGDEVAGESASSGIWVLPLFLEGSVSGLLEVWSRPEEGQLLGQALMRFSDIVPVFWQRQQQRASDQQETWNRIDAFARRIHASLHPTEVAFLVANEGRQLIGCDRLGVALKHGRKCQIEALSGVEKVDQRANLIRRMRSLCDRVIAWGEPLRFRGTRDDTLPPRLLHELDLFLEESHSKQLVIVPLPDGREANLKMPARSALVLESFATTEPLEILEERLKVVGGHAASALYNSSSYRQVPLRFLWLPIAKVQEGLGGKTRAILYSVAAALVALALCLVFVPYPLKMDAKGQLLPQERQWVYSPVEGKIVRFEEGVEPAAFVHENQDLLLLFDVQLENKLVQLGSEVAAADQKARALASQARTAATESDRLRLSAEQQEQDALRDRKLAELNSLRRRTNSDVARPGHFFLKSPLTGTVLNHGFRETLIDRHIRPADPLLRIGNKKGSWEVELRIPQQHIGQVVQAFPHDDPDAELDVDLLVISTPTRTFTGKLAREKLAGEATPDEEQGSGESEPVVIASIRIDGDDIPADRRIPRELLVAGTEVRAKVRCGDHAMGYSLFYGVWEFVYENVIFFF